MISKKTRLFLVAAAALVAVAAIAITAQARKIDNAGAVSFSFNTGVLKIGDETFDAADGDPIIFNGTVAANGNVTIPQGNIQFPPLDPIDGPLGPINVSINPLGPATGNVNPYTGVSSISLSVRVDIDGTGVGGDCKVSPIHLAASSSTIGASPFIGVPYNTTDGSVTVVDKTFSVPGASGCSTFPINVNNEINSQLGLPSPSGNNAAVLGATTTPILRKAVRATLSATPDSGFEPLASTLSAAGSVIIAGAHPTTPYSWDFDGNGTFDQTTTTSSVAHNYTTPGTYNARVRVMDVDGDFDIATKQVNVQARVPDLTIAKSHTDEFIAGEEADFKINVSSIGTGDGNGPVTVTDTLDPRFTLVSASGAGWDCSASAGQDVTCTRPDGYAQNENLPEITVRVAIAGAAGNQLIENIATVSNASDGVAGNNSGSDSVTPTAAGVDLALTKSTDSPAFLRGRRGTYEIAVKNQGTQPTTGNVVVSDALPAGTQLVSAFGPGFDCEASTASNVSCELRPPNSIAAGSTSVVSVRVDVASNAPSSLENTASVDAPLDNDSDTSNNSDTETTPVRDTGVDLTVSKSHSGTFVKGDTETYTIIAKNQGTLGTAGPITVTDTLPAGLEFVSAAGGNWNCTGEASSPTVTCVRPSSLQSDTQAPAITLRVKVKEDAETSVTNLVDVTNEPISNPNHLDLDPSNNSDEDQTDVRALVNDLSIDKSHTGNFIAGSPASFNIKVKNEGADPTNGTISVTDEVPASFAVSAVSGTGWSCSTGQSVTCTRTAALAPGASAPDIVISGTALRSAAPSVSNTATVATSNDGNNANDSDTDVATVALPVANTTPVTSINGSVTYPSTGTGNATFTINVTRSILGIYNGTVRIVDPGANHNIQGTVNLFNSVGRTGFNGATGNATLSNGQRILWSVDDLSAINLGPDEVYAAAPSGYDTVTARQATAGNITVLPAP